MAFVDFYQQSILFDLPPHDPDLHYGFSQASTTRFVADENPAHHLEDHSVFVDIDVFIQSVLHAPPDWKAQWAPAIRAVKWNTDFMNHYLQYREGECAEPEESRYEPLLLMNDATLRVAFPATLSQDTPPISLPLTELVRIIDDESSDCVLNEGSSIPQLVAKEEHPPSDSLQTSSRDAISSSRPENTRKRKRDTSCSPERKRRRLGVTSAPGRVNLEIDWVDSFPSRPQRQPKQSDEVGRQLLELLSIRPHVTVGLVDGRRIQFYHANHSVVLVSSIIDLSLHNDEGGIDTLIAILIAFRRLSLHDRRIVEHVHNATILRLEGNEKLEGPIEVELGTAISLSPSLIGRSTAVIDGTSPRWPESRVVVKISWVDGYRISEEEFMDKAVEEATNSGHGWALNHLPRFFYVEDVRDPTDRSVQELLKMARFGKGKYTYERRQMRIVVQELLHPLKGLGSVRDIGQVMVDVTCVHRWLYDHAGILHGDLSPSNIMYRVIEGQVHGVLTDYDLSFWKAALSGDDGKMSQEVTGTRPYMAEELLGGKSPVHLYRHDAESMFYVMLITFAHHTICRTGVGSGGEDKLQVVRREGKLPYQDWFEEGDKILGVLKWTLFSHLGTMKLSPSFEAFRMWLVCLRRFFRQGKMRKVDHELYETREQVPWWARSDADEHEPAPFDEETLGGCITYSTLIEPVRHLTGELEGLVIRYDPSPYLPRLELRLTDPVPPCD